ncbi:phosphotransferase family protein [Leifsonia sp. NPDC058292]|uniref:phosphotransferase family protein n=1 Tax=Leifsonia sp. NPDC058292 TaxID=3346428 RepID=UPI0036D8F8F5
MESFRDAVSAAVGRSDAEPIDVVHVPLDYDAFLAHRAVGRVRGAAVVDGERLPWSMIEKRTEGPDSASPYLRDNGLRELAAYRSRLFDDMPPGIRAPRAYGTLLEPDGAITLWLEDVPHEGARPLDGQAMLTAARHLGEMNGRWFGRAVEPWMFEGWIDRHAQPEAVERSLELVRSAHPAVVARLGDRVALAERLMLDQPRVREVLEALPQTLCHHDAVGANVIRTGPATVLIDWESVGPGTVGADLASLLFASVRRGDASAVTVAAVLDDAVRAYTDGFRSESADVASDEIRRGFDAAVALRWKLAADVVETIASGRPARRGSLPDEAPGQALDELVSLVDLVLDTARRVLD